MKIVFLNNDYPPYALGLSGSDRLEYGARYGPAGTFHSRYYRGFRKESAGTRIEGGVTIHSIFP